MGKYLTPLSDPVWFQRGVTVLNPYHYPLTINPTPYTFPTPFTLHLHPKPS